MYHNVAHDLLLQIGKVNPCDGGAAMQKQHSLPDVHIDPVCAMEVNPDSADYKPTYKSHTYYFCAEGCKKTFEASPAKFAGATKSGKKKGWWGRHVDRLKDIKCDRSMECHH